MILQALYDYYQRKAADPESRIAPQGFEWKEIPFIIVVDEDGNFINLEDTRSGEGKRKVATSFLVIKTKGRTGANSYQTANVLWDHFGYVLAHPKEKDDKKTKEQLLDDANRQHVTFVSSILELTKKFPDNKQFRSVANFLENSEQKQKVFEHECWIDCIKISGCNFSFRLAGEIGIVAENEDLKNNIPTEVLLNDEEGNTESDLAKGVCLITGEYGPVAVLHTSTSIPGGKSGAKLVGFQTNSGYDSYYKEQGLNAPVSKKAEDAYTTALNVLLSRDSTNKFRLSDLTVVFWADKANEFENIFPFFLAAPSKDDPDRNSREVKALFDSIHTGRFNDEVETTFYILGLSPNAARISIRFWKTGKINDFAKKIALHFSDLEIIHGKNDVREFFSLFNLLSHIAFEYKVDNVAPNLTGKMVECILDGSPYPATLQQQCIRRIRAEQNVNRVRAAILKAFLNRKNRIYNINEKLITMALDLENTNQGYLCGRLFAVLEKIQEEAQPGINATIKDRYYGAASSTPVTVFGRLLGLSNHHLAKLNPGRKTNFEKMVQEIMDGINSSGMPAHLSLDDQSRFAIGYYHQRQDLFTKKETNN
jgi:CRISPR-associated protein Csd1